MFRYQTRLHTSTYENTDVTIYIIMIDVSLKDADVAQICFTDSNSGISMSGTPQGLPVHTL